MTAEEMRQRSEAIENFTRVKTLSGEKSKGFENVCAPDSVSEDDSDKLNGDGETIHDQMNNQTININERDDGSEGKLNFRKGTKNTVPEDIEINTEDIRSKLNELLASDDTDEDVEITMVLSRKTKNMKRRRIQAFDSDSDKNEDIENISDIQKNQNESAIVAKKKKPLIESDGE